MFFRPGENIYVEEFFKATPGCMADIYNLAVFLTLQRYLKYPFIPNKNSPILPPKPVFLWI